MTEKEFRDTPDYVFTCSTQRTDISYSAGFTEYSQDQYLIAQMNLRGFWFKFDYKSLAGKTVANKQQRVKIDVDFSSTDDPGAQEYYGIDDLFLENENGEKFLGKLWLNGYDPIKDSYDGTELHAYLSISLPLEMLQNLLQLTKEQFVGFGATVKWQEADPEIFYVKNVNISHEYSSVYDFTGKFPKKHSDHFHYKT